MQISHSRIETFNKCPYQYKLKYIDKLDTLPDDDPANALKIGSALHKAIETDLKTAIDEYYNSYPIITDKHIDEALKLEHLIPRVKELLPEDGIHEIKIGDDDYVGFIDYLVPLDTLTMIDFDLNDNYKWFDLYDFKYSNNVKNYMDSEQLHLYKYYFEKQHPNCKIRDMYFMFVPKSSIRIKYKNKKNKRDEPLYEFRKRIIEDLKSKEIQFIKIEYNPNKVIEFLTNTKHAIECSEFEKKQTKYCDWCQFKQYCESNGEIDYEIIRRK